MKAFLCHTSQDSAFVIEVAKHLMRNLNGVFYYEDYQRSDTIFQETINKELNECEVMVIFAGANFTEWQKVEALWAHKQHISGKLRSFFTVLLFQGDGSRASFPKEISMLDGFSIIEPKAIDSGSALRVAAEIVRRLGLSWRSADDLPLNPHLFDYEKHIIEFFNLINSYGNSIFTGKSILNGAEEGRLQNIRRKLLNGCPSEWPSVVLWKRPQAAANQLSQNVVGNWRPENAGVLTAALSSYNTATANDGGASRMNASAQVQESARQLSFPEAGPRDKLYFPRAYNELRVAVLVSGGIAPGINAVVDGIVQRHWLYAEQHGYKDTLTIYGFQNGFRAFDNLDQYIRYLAATPKHYLGMDRRLETSNHVNEGGSILGTSRVDKLINISGRADELKKIDDQLLNWCIDVLYVIGGDGSMKAAHAIWSTAQENPTRKENPARGTKERLLSVVAIPKTTDNDVLWVWQSFGFLSAVEKAREVIEHLSTEITSNPRLCVVQLFGSDSGFVVSHAVLASATGHCSLALIPEIKFSMRHIALYLKKIMCQERQRIPFALVVMSETAIPVDSMDYVGEEASEPVINIGLNDEEKDAIRTFQGMRKRGERIQGQTNDALRTAGLKIVSRGLERLLPDPGIAAQAQFQPDWDRLRVFTNEPRHLLRAIPPSCSDIIIGHRLGTLAVDNAMAGYTDFMISQWLTEYVLVPLKLVVLGRKRIPTSGIFWKSVLAKTSQPPDLA